MSDGDIAPPFALPKDTGSKFDLYGDDVAGNFIAIVFCPGGIELAAKQLQGFAEHFDSLRRHSVIVVAISDEPQSMLTRLRRDLALPFDLLSDSERKLFTGYGIAADSGAADAHPVTVLVRPNLHCLGVIHDGEHAQATLETVAKQREWQREARLGFQAPILMVPDVLTHDDCRHLIDIYNAPNVPMVNIDDLQTVTGNGDVKTRVADYGRQDRIDHFITTPETKSFISKRLGTRLLPEIRKAFHYTVTGFEGLRIARYKGERGGRSHGHRDNSQPDVAHRRFALSINLNTESFEGGEIRFPEYGARRYRAETGAALVFSCSLLHEALAVTAGERLVLLAFLNGNQ